MSSSKRALLSKTRFAAGMSPDVCRRLAALATVTEVPPGTAVIREGEPIAALGVVISGRIALRLNLPGVGPQTILTVDDGDVFGWSAVMPGSLSTSTGTALVATQTLMFERERLLAAMAEDCELASAVYQRMLKVVARRLAATRVQLLDLYHVGHAS